MRMKYKTTVKGEDNVTALCTQRVHTQASVLKQREAVHTHAIQGPYKLAGSEKGYTSGKHLNYILCVQVVKLTLLQ